MLCLIKKELTANTRYVLIGFVIFVLYAFFFSANGDGLFMLCLIFCYYSVAVTNLTIDERYHINMLLATLPIRRRDVIVSKYLLAAIISVFCVLLYLLAFPVFRALGLSRFPALTPVGFSFGLFILSVLNGVLLPLSYKFSAQSIRYVGIFLVMAFFILSSLIGSSLLSDLLTALPRLSTAQLSLVLIAAAVGISVLSFLLTNSIYAKKDL